MTIINWAIKIEDIYLRFINYQTNRVFFLLTIMLLIKKEKEETLFELKSFASIKK